MAAAGGPIRYRPIPLDSIAPPLVAAVLTAEDARFRQHRGIDWHEVRRASAIGAPPSRGARRRTGRSWGGR